MTAIALKRPQRRGACPGLSAPMPTGDGLLLRLLPVGTIPLAAFGKLCAAALTHGNGVIEITARGSIQVRGLNAASAPRFADAVAALDIAAEDGVPVLSNALAGLGAEEILDGGALAADLRRALARRVLAARLAPKVSVVIDGGSALGLDGVSADVRLRAGSINDRVTLYLAVGGDGASATQLGVVLPDRGVEAAVRLLEMIAQRGRDARARDVLAAEGIAPFLSALSSCPAIGVRRTASLRSPMCRASMSGGLNEVKNMDGRDQPGHDGTGARRDVIGAHRLRDGSLAYGVGLAFGHAEAAALGEMAAAAAAAGARGMRAAPGRALMIIGLTNETAAALAADAERLGFIVRADDPRRHVVACAGAPICASAHIAARALAPRVAEIAAPYIDGSFTIHISGCTKGCAHPALAALTVVGTPEGCALIANGSARDTPHDVMPTSELPAVLARNVREAKRGGGHV